MPTPQTRRRAVDACPGALRLHAAADGPLARVRLPGGLLTGPQLTVLRELAETWGDGHLELTSRANLQLRALKTAPAADLAARLWAAGLLPSTTHELVRNIAASPLAGAPVRALVHGLDTALCADPALAELPGRFLFAVDDGSGDVAPSADVAAVATVPAGGEFAIVLAGVDVGLRVGAGRVVEALLAAAHAFLSERQAAQDGDPEWRLRELGDGPARVGARVAAAVGLPWDPAVQPAMGPGPRAPIGIVGQADGRVAAGALVRLGRLDRVRMRVLENAELLVVTPWRGVVVPDLSPPAAESWLRTLADAGFEVAAGSRWSGVTACAGRPGCAQALTDVRHDAAAITTSEVDDSADRLPVHRVGCARGCGSPAGAHVRVEATGSGYSVGRVGDLDQRDGDGEPGSPAAPWRAEPSQAERERIKLDPTEREQAQLERVQLELAQPKRADPERAELADPQRAQPERARPEQARPERAQPERAQPERAQPRPADPQQARPEQARPEQAQPERAQLERAQPQPADPERAQLEPAQLDRVGELVALARRF